MKRTSVIIAIAVALALLFGACIAANVGTHYAHASTRCHRRCLIRRNTKTHMRIRVLSSKPRPTVLSDGRTVKCGTVYVEASALASLPVIHDKLEWSWNLSAARCWNGRKVIKGTMRWHVWYVIGTEPWNMWDSSGLVSQIIGPTKACHDGAVSCWNPYERSYGKFTFNAWLYHHVVTPYVAMTVRGDGSFTSGHS